MGLDKIVTRVVADSKANEANIIAEANKEREELLHEAAKKRAEILETFRVDMEKTISQMKVRAEAGMEIDVKKEMLSTRKHILENMFEKVLEHFRDIPDANKRKLYSSLTAKLLGEFTQGTIHCRRGEEHLFRGIGQFTVGEPIDTAGGFLAESADGNLVMDMRFEGLLKELWDDNLDKISNLLFEDGEVQ